jgi:DNA polymerase III epsilon subunit-like protein
MDPATPLRDLPLAVIDTETTGFDPDTGGDRVVDVAVVHTTLAKGDGPGGGAPARLVLQTLVNPERPIPEKTTAVHGITDAMVADRMPFDRELAERIREECGGRLLVGYGAAFDHRFLRSEFTRLGEVPLPWPWLDLAVVRKATVTGGRPGKLSELAADAGIVLDAHGAAGDALATAMLAHRLLSDATRARAFHGPQGARGYALAERYGEAVSLPKVATVGALLAWQREAALYQERDFHAYALRQGWRDAPGCPWHLAEGVEPPAWTRDVPSVPCSTCGVRVRHRVAKDGSTSTVDRDTGAAHVCGGA